MCGIAGIVRLDREKLSESDLNTLRSMTNALAHRGPDDEGLHISSSGSVAFGHRRLSIIDPTPEAHQPMVLQRGEHRSFLTFNGEIFNYRELERDTSVAIPNSDTAVLLSLLAESGLNALPKLRGFFAFAFHGESTGKTIIARDAFGMKPVYFATRNNRFYFSSELRPLVTSGAVPFQISNKGLSAYLSYYNVPAPFSVIEGVSQLPAGHVVSIDQTGAVSISRWYRLQKYDPIAISYADAKVELRSRLEAAVQYRLVSDAPLGIFLSAGIDSNVVTALAQQASRSQLNTFSIGFRTLNGTHDETTPASESAKHFGTTHHTHLYSADEVFSHLGKFFSRMDSPTGDGLNSFLVARAAREADPDLKVALTGTGGDEQFIGYKKFRFMARHPALSNILSRMPPLPFSNKMSSLQRSVKDPLRTRILFYLNEQRLLTVVEPNTSVVDELILRSHLAGEASTIMKILRNDIEQYLPSMLLRDLDVTTMSQSLEGRCPLLDVPLVEFVWNLPLKLRTRGATKQLLYDSCKPLLPDYLRQRKKTGFEMPIADWLRGGAFSTLLNLLKTADLRIVEDGILRGESVKSVAHEFISGRVHYLKVWSIIALEFWYRSFTEELPNENWSSRAR